MNWAEEAAKRGQAGEVVTPTVDLLDFNSLIELSLSLSLSSYSFSPAHQRLGAKTAEEATAAALASAPASARFALFAWTDERKETKKCKLTVRTFLHWSDYCDWKFLLSVRAESFAG